MRRLGRELWAYFPGEQRLIYLRDSSVVEIWHKDLAYPANDSVAFYGPPTPNRNGR